MPERFVPRFSRGVAWSLLAAVFAAGFLIPLRAAVDLAPRVSVLTAVFACAATFNLALTAGLSRVHRPRVDRTAALSAIGLALCTVAGNGGISLALPEIGAGMTSAVMKAQVLLTPVLAIWLLREPVSRRLWVGALVALVGFVLPQWLEGGAPGGGAPGGGASGGGAPGVGASGGGVGYLGALLAAISFSAMQILTRRVITAIQPATVNALRLVIAVAALQLFESGRAAWDLPVEVWGLAALAGLLGPGFSRLCLMAALRHVSPSISALVALTGPVYAFGLGYLFFGEAPTWLEAAGAVLILAGVTWPLAPSLRFGRPTRS